MCEKTYGQDPADRHWGCPLRERWQLAAHQQLSPGWQQQLAFTLTVTTSYEGAAALLRQLGHRADDATLHALAQTLGGRVEQQTQRRLKEPAIEQTPQRAASEVGVLMLDGWQVRQRGPGWGKKKKQQPRVAWHELKTGVFYLQEQAARKNGRGILSDKVVVSWQGEPMELGRRLRQAACEHGLGRARQKLVVSDGAPWIWNVAQDRWNGAVEVLDFYHASQHVWALGEAVHGEGERARGWVEKQLHQLRHGRHAAALRTIAGLKPGRGQAGEVIRREQNYFASHAARMNYRAVSAGRLRPGGISLFATSRSVQTQRPILDAARLAPLVCLDRSPPERSLGPTLESVTGGVPVKCTKSHGTVLPVDTCRSAKLFSQPDFCETDPNPPVSTGKEVRRID